MQADEQHKIRYFPSYEAREAALAASVGHLIPCRHNGPRQFWRDFRKIAGGDLGAAIRGDITYVAADPRDSLAFGSPRQVLSAACMCAGTGVSDQRAALRQLAGEMEIAPLLNQPLRTLSGGESVKLALAKALALAGSSSGLVVASPFSWLSRSNRALFDRVLEAYRNRQVPAETLALDGEDDLFPIQAQDVVDAEPARLAFTLRVSGVQVALGSPVNAITDEQRYARIADFQGDLVSPCLFAGGNGQGKSLLAKSLSGALVTRGRLAVQSRDAAGKARLLFQDVITQTLLRSFDGIVAAVKTGRRQRTLALYRQLERMCAQRQPREDGAAAAGARPGMSGQRTLLEIKTLLVAARLAERPPALILDEPDWGLSRSASIALVTAVIATAHAQGVPVILISHKPWWRPLAGSVLNVAKVPGPAGGPPFIIGLEQG